MQITFLFVTPNGKRKFELIWFYSEGFGHSKAQTDMYNALILTRLIEGHTDGALKQLSHLFVDFSAFLNTKEYGFGKTIAFGNSDSIPIYIHNRSGLKSFLVSSYDVGIKELKDWKVNSIEPRNKTYFRTS